MIKNRGVFRCLLMWDLVTYFFDFILKVFARELDNILWCDPDDLFRVRLEYPWEVRMHYDLVSVENPHLSRVCHL